MKLAKTMDIKRDDYYIRDLKASDRYKLRKWTDFEDPIFYGYNFSDMTEGELWYWYNSKQAFYRSKYFSILDYKENLLGYLGIKEYNYLLKTGKLGIVLDAKVTSRGLGYAVMQDFLDYYFNDLNMRRLDLEVNAWNTRARRLYDKLGFRQIGQEWQRFENQQINLDQSKYDDLAHFFEERDRGLYNIIYKMRLTRKEYEEGLCARRTR